MAYSEASKKYKTIFDSHHLTVKKSHAAPGINDFDILKPISRGAFGQVYLAQRKNNSKKLFALKAMKKSDVRTKNMMEQVYNERDALAISSKSPFVVQLFYSFQSDEKIYLVMEYMIGGDLKSLLHNIGYFDEQMSTFYIAEVVLALEYLHSHSIYHRDIKPDNMLLSDTGHVKLTDFGLSRLTSERKPNFRDLINTPGENVSDEGSKIGKIFWRTPGQLQSLTSKFTFSIPRVTSKRDRHNSNGNVMSVIKSINNSQEFVFSPPQLPDGTTCAHDSNVSFLSTPKNSKIILTPNVNQQLPTLKVSHCGGDNASTGLTTDVMTLNLEKRAHKRSYIDIYDEEFDKENEFNDGNARKRVRVYSQSLPSGLEISLVSLDATQMSNISSRTNQIVTFNENVCEYGNSESDESSTVNSTEQGVTKTVHEDTDSSQIQHELSSYVNISGVANLTESIQMSICDSAFVSPVDSMKQFGKNNSGIKEHIMMHTPSPSQSSTNEVITSPSLTPISVCAQERRNSEVIVTPIQTLRFCESPGPSKNEVKRVLVTPEGVPYKNEENAESIQKSGVYIKKTPEGFLSSENTFCTPKQTQFRTPKSCVRGKATPAERRRILGTPDYLAPEILLGKPHAAPVDWWALGICFYEFLTGIPPFNDDTPELVFGHILDHDLIWPEGEESLSPVVVSAINKMLTIDPDERPKAQEIKEMICFNKFNWKSLHSEQAPFIPQPDNAYDTTYFDARLVANRLQMSNFKP